MLIHEDNGKLIRQTKNVDCLLRAVSELKSTILANKFQLKNKNCNLDNGDKSRIQDLGTEIIS